MGLVWQTFVILGQLKILMQFVERLWLCEKFRVIFGSHDYQSVGACGSSVCKTRESTRVLPSTNRLKALPITHCLPVDENTFHAMYSVYGYMKKNTLICLLRAAYD